MRKKYFYIIIFLVSIFIFQNDPVYSQIDPGWAMNSTAPTITSSPTLINLYDEYSGGHAYFKFVPTSTATYNIYTTASGNLVDVGELFNGVGTSIAYHDAVGGCVTPPCNFTFSVALTAGQLYYLKIYNWMNWAGTNIQLYITGGGLAQLPTVSTDAIVTYDSVTATLPGTVNANNYSTGVFFKYGTSVAYGSSDTAAPNPVTGSTPTSISRIITGLIPNTTYHYQANGVSIVGSAAGADQTFTTLTARPVVTTDSVSSIGSISVTMHGTVNAMNSTTWVYVDYGLTTAYGNVGGVDQNPLNGMGNQAVTNHMGALIPNTTYHYRIWANNAAGSTFGGDQTFTTLSIPPSVTTNPADNINASGARLNGNVNPNNNLTTVTFKYGTTPGGPYPNTVNADQTPMAGYIPQPATSSIISLTPNTTYYYVIVGNNGVGGDVMSSESSFTTLAVPPTVSTLAATNVTGTDAQFNGTVDANNSSTAVSFDYGFTTSYGLTETADQGSLNGLGNQTVSKTIVSNLIPNMIYHFRVSATNSAGTTMGLDQSFTTLSTPPYAGIDNADNISDSSGRLKAVINPNNNTTIVKFKYGIASGVYSDSIPADQSPMSGFNTQIATATISGLNPNTTYYYVVTANNGIGGTITSSELSFTTLPIPPTVGSPSATGVSAFSSTLNGMVNANNSTTVVLFKYGKTSGGPYIYTDSTAAIESPVSGLTGTPVSKTISVEPNTTYYFRIKGMNGTGGDIHSTENTFTTTLIDPVAISDSADNITASSGRIWGTVTANNSNTNVYFNWDVNAGCGNSISCTPNMAFGMTPTSAYTTLSGLQPNQTMYYHVTAWNGTSNYIFGTVKSFTTLPIPPNVVTNSADNITDISARLNGTITANNSITTPTFQYGFTSGGPYPNTLPADQTSLGGMAPTPVTGTIGGLMPNMTVYYVAVGNNGTGGDVYGSEMSFTTQSAPPIVSTDPAGIITGTTTIVNGNVNPNNNLTTVTFQYGLTSGGPYPYTVAADQNPINGSTNTPITCTLINLIPDTTYYFVAVGNNGIGGDITGFEMSFTTPAMPPSVLNMPADNIHQSGATLHGTINPNNKSTNVKFYYGTTSGTYPNMLSATPSPISGFSNTPVACTLYTLTPNTTYYYTISANNGTGGDIYDSELSFATPAIPPTCTTGIADSITTCSAYLHGIVKANNSTTTVLFKYGLVSGGPYPNIVSAIPGTVTGNSFTSVKCKIDSLISNTRYYYIIVANNGTGGDISSSQGSFITLAGTLIASPPSLQYNINKAIKLDSSVIATIRVSSTFYTPQIISQMTFVPVSPLSLNQTFAVIENPAPLTIPANGFKDIKIRITGNNSGKFSTIFRMFANSNQPTLLSSSINDGGNKNLKIPQEANVTFLVVDVPINGEVTNSILSVNRDSIDFGYLNYNGVVAHQQITLTNNSSSMIFIARPIFENSPPILKMSSNDQSNIKSNINSIQSIPSFTVTPDDTIMLQPGTTRTLDIEINPLTAGTFIDTLELYNSSSNIPELEIPVKAVVGVPKRPAEISLDTTLISFDTLGYMASSKDSIIKITNLSPDNALSINSVSIVDPGSTTQSPTSDNVFQVLGTFPINIDPSSSKPLTIRFVTNKIGTFSKVLHIINNSANKPDQTVLLNGAVIGSKISVTPKNINFGNIGLNSAAKDTVINITNTGIYKLNIKWTPKTDSIFSVIGTIPSTGVDIEPGATYTGLSIRVKPSRLGIIADSLIITSNASNSQSEKVTFSAIVIQSSFAINPQSMDFGATSLEQRTIKKSFYVSNIGSSGLNVDTVSLTGDTSYIISKGLSTKAFLPGQRDSIEITFHPRSSGSKTAVLTILSNDQTGKKYTAQITGTGGGKPVLFSSLSGVNFSDIWLGTAKDTSFFIRNDGNLDLVLSDASITGANKEHFGNTSPSTTLLSASQTATIKVNASGSLPLGDKTAELQITNNDPSAGVLSIGLAASIKAPIISKTANLIQIDSVFAGMTHETTISIRNDGNVNLLITGLGFDGPSAVNYAVSGISTDDIIQPGEEKTFKLLFSPSGVGDFNARMLINSNDPMNPQVSFILNGKGKIELKPAIMVSDTTLNFGYVTANTNKDLSFTISNTGTAALNISSLNITGTNSNLFKISGSTPPFSINASGHQMITVSYTSDSNFKNAFAQLTIQSNDPNRPAIILSLAAASQKPLIQADSILRFTATGVNESTKQNITFTNNSTIPLIIDSMYIDPSLTGLLKMPSDANDQSSANVFTLDSYTYPIKVNPLSQAIITITFKPDQPKSYSTYLNIISSNAMNSPRKILLTGKAAKPVMSVNRDPLNYGFVELNSYKDTILTIGNTGQIPLQISSIEVTGPNASQFSVFASLPLTIDAMGTKDITIRFLPGSNKTLYLANLIISGNDLENPSVALSLSGSGDAPTIASDSTVDFGKIVIADSLIKVLKISNASNLNLRIDSISLISNIDNSFSFDNIKLPVTLPAKGSVTLNIKFNPKAAKNYTAYLNIVSTDKSNNPVKVKLSGSTTTPKMTLPDKIVMGRLKLGLNKTIKFGIQNSGEAYLLINNIKLSGVDTNEFQISPRTYPYKINAGQIDSLLVQFNPKTTGIKNGKILITSNDPSAAGEIAIEAEGIQQNLAIDPLSINFGEITYTRTKTDSVILQNLGSDNITVNSVSFSGLNTKQFSFASPVGSFVLAPNAKRAIQIIFSADSIGTKSANLDINSTDAVNPKLTVSLSGICISPSISSAANQINLGNVRIATTRDSLLVISNTGKGILKISSISITGKDSADFKITKSNIGKEMPNGGKDTISFSFTPVTNGDKAASLVIRSNDFNTPALNIALSGKGISPKLSLSAAVIDMGKVFTIKSKDTTVSITNSGTDNLLLKNITVTGVDSKRFQISSLKYPGLKNLLLNPNETQVLQIKYSPQDTGKMKAAISFESDDPNLAATEIQLIGEGYIPQIVLDNDLLAAEDSIKTISFHLTDNFVPKNVKIFFKKGNESVYGSVDAAGSIPAGALNYTYTFDKNIITRNGFDFYLKVEWEGALTTLPGKNYAGNPFSLTIRMKVVNSAIQLVTKSYSMVTVPLIFQQTTLLTEMIRNLGAINNSSWRIFKVRNNDDAEYIDETLWQIRAGDGFWLICKENKVIDFQNCMTVPTNTPYTITLLPGWNQIGSPFMFPISLSNLSIPAGKRVENVLWAWNDGTGYSIVNTTLSPWTGYFINNNETSNVDITVSAAGSTTLAKTDAVDNTSLLPEEWKIMIETNLNGRINNSAEIGCLRNSSDGWDQNDISEPPFINGKYYSIRFPHNEMNSTKLNYVRDYKSISQDGKTWDMEIMNLTNEKVGEFKISLAGNIPENYQIVLYDCDLNRTHKIFNNSKIKFEIQNETKRFRIAAGTKEYMENNSPIINKVDRYLLSQNYPNPFNPSTMISYQIPVDGFVNLKVFDVIGKEISTLVSKTQSAGSYTVTWKADGYPSGIYYYKLQSGNYNDMKKMILMR